MAIIDITQELFTCRVYPGDAGPSFRRAQQMPADVCNLTEIALGVHNGTHADAPLHFIENGDAIDALDLEVFYGPCAVAPAGADIAPYLNERRLLLKGGRTVSPDEARIIAASAVRLLGVEPQSVATAEDSAAVHQTLLGAGVALLEGLDLSRAEAGAYTLAAFPLKLGGCEGSPVRAALIKGNTM